MLKQVTKWFDRTFSDPQAVILTAILVLSFAFILLFGKVLGPVLAAVVFAYLLDNSVRKLCRAFGMQRFAAVMLVYIAFIVFLIYTLIFILPLAYEQLVQFISNSPEYISYGKQQLERLTNSFPTIIGKINESFAKALTSYSEDTVSAVLKFVPGMINVLIYLVMVPILIFFILKDKKRIYAWFERFLPEDHSLASSVWLEVDHQLGNYVRGKFWEVIIVSAVTYLGFLFFDLQYALLLAVLVGLSVLIPYIGAIVVTIPVALVALAQFGFSAVFGYVMSVYLIIQMLDGYVLVPVLFSEAVNLHPVAILSAILLFGGLWGILGLIFAIPLAVLIQAVISAWPRQKAGKAPAPQ